MAFGKNSPKYPMYQFMNKNACNKNEQRPQKTSDAITKMHYLASPKKRIAKNKIMGIPNTKAIILA